VKAEDIEHATGLELAELEALVEGKDLFLDSDVKWLDAVIKRLCHKSSCNVCIVSMFFCCGLTDCNQPVNPD
jgi:hypothetical protein